jgi:hypothetical protein
MPLKAKQELAKKEMKQLMLKKALMECLYG